MRVFGQYTGRYARGCLIMLPKVDYVLITSLFLCAKLKSFGN